jgi:hypothetical protein
MLLSDKVKISTALDYASGTADRTGAIIDMGGYEGVLMIVKLAAVATGGVNSIKAQTATAVGFGTPHDVAGTAQTIADDDDNQVFVIDLKAPAERFVRLFVDKDATNACAESAVYVRYGGGYAPETNAATDAVSIETFYQPLTGTA